MKLNIRFVGDGKGRYQVFCLPGGARIVAGSVFGMGKVPDWLLKLKPKHKVRFLINGIRADKWLAKNAKPMPKPNKPKPRPGG